MDVGFLIPEEKRPKWFSYDDSFIFFARNNIVTMLPLRFLDAEGQIANKRYIFEKFKVDCVPFCIDGGLDEFFCWIEIEDNLRCIRCPFDSDEFTIIEYYSDFWEFMKHVVDRMKEHMD